MFICLAKGKRVTRQSSSYSVSEKSLTPSPAGKAVFSNLRDLVDSEESESEKRARKTKKIILLDSDEDSVESGGEERIVDEEKKYSVIESDSSDKEKPLNSKKSSSKSDESDTGNMDVNRNKQDSVSNGEGPCEVASSDSD